MEAITRVVWCLMLAVSSCDSSQPDPTQLFLDSPAHCGKVYNVTNTSVYQVSKTNALHPFRACDLIFTPTHPTDHVCVFQRELNFTTCDVKIQLHDGHVGVDKVTRLTVDCSYLLPVAEWCSYFHPSLSFRLDTNGPRPSLSDLDIDLKVYSLQSVYRHVSMETAPACSSKLSLDRSRINVTNIDSLHSIAKRQNTRPTSECSLTFQYVGTKLDTFLCIEFHSVRAASPLCTTPNYTRQISLNGQDVIGVRSCQDPEPIKWCSNSTEITLRLTRHGTPEAKEDEVVFYALVLDQAGPFFDCFFCTTTAVSEVPSVNTVPTVHGSDTGSVPVTTNGSDTATVPSVSLPSNATTPSERTTRTTRTGAATDTNTLAIGLGAAGCALGLATVLGLGLLWGRKSSPANNALKANATPATTNDNNPTTNATTNGPVVGDLTKDYTGRNGSNTAQSVYSDESTDTMSEASDVSDITDVSEG